MIYEIKNDYLTVKINSLGAEIFSVFGNKTNTEFIWQAVEKYWVDRSPVLFPFCGRLFNKKYIYKGKEYEMGLHGFAWKSEYKLNKMDIDYLELSLSDSEESLEIYPFKFEFIVGYKLNKNAIEFSFKVINKDTKDIYFEYGGHPGFNVPINGVGNFEDYYLEFSKNKYNKRIFSDSVLDTCTNEKFKLVNKKYHLHHDMFDNDAIFLEDDKDVITLKSNLNNNYIRITFKNMKYVGFWHANMTDAPYICVEPSCGFPGREGIVEDIETKPDVNKLRKGRTYKNTYKVEFYVE